MSVSPSDTNQSTAGTTTAAAPVPKRITNAQTVCNEKNAKGKLCNGHLKQLRTAGEASEVHLRGDDVLFKCQTCGTFYMGPPLGHVRDPDKQSRFVEAELTALLQAAGGTLPVIRKNEKGVYVLVEAGSEHGAAAAKAVPPKAAATAPATAQQQAQGSAAVAPAAPKPTTPAAQKPAVQKAGAEPNRQLFKRSTYAGVVDTGPVPGETFEQKVTRLKAVAAGAKQRAEEGGGEAAPSAEQIAPAAVAAEVRPATVTTPAAQSEPDETPAQVEASGAAPKTAAQKPTGQADRTLMKRSAYSGVVDTGPVPGETFEQKVERLRAVAAAAKQRAEEGG
jgi:hypothetical protein